MPLVSEMPRDIEYRTFTSLATSLALQKRPSKPTARDLPLLERLYCMLSDRVRVLHQPEGLRADWCFDVVLSIPL